MEKSSYTRIDLHGKTTIVYRNVYVLNGKIYYNSKGENLPYVETFGDRNMWAPIVDEIEEGEFTKVNLACYSMFIWIHNIGHCFFDALYPVFVSMIRAGYFNSDFHAIADTFDGKNSMGYSAIEKFCGKKNIELSSCTDKLIIDTLVCGTLGVGNVVMGPNPVMYGQNEFGSMSLFRERMMRKLGIRHTSSEKLRCIIIDNKRYTDYDKESIRECIKEMSEHIDIKYVDWRHDFSCLKDQLKYLSSVDIHVTGPGTGMMYMPFLKNGSVNINLGFMEHTQTNHSRPNIKILESKKEDHLFPSYMEQYVCSTANYVSTLYYNRYKFNNIEASELICLIKKAIELIESGTTLEVNYYKDMEVFKEYCKRSKDSEKICRYLTDIAYFPEMFVNEHPYSINRDFVDLELLRQIKDELGYDRSYEVI